jgi:hypothetical protein
MRTYNKIARIKEKTPASEKQKNYLKLLDIPFEKNISKYDAMVLLDLAIKLNKKSALEFHNAFKRDKS